MPGELGGKTLKIARTSSSLTSQLGCYLLQQILVCSRGQAIGRFYNPSAMRSEAIKGFATKGGELYTAYFDWTVLIKTQGNYRISA